jgi:hypothetical protein
LDFYIEYHVSFDLTKKNLTTLSQFLFYFSDIHCEVEDEEEIVDGDIVKVTVTVARGPDSLHEPAQQPSKTEVNQRAQ